MDYRYVNLTETWGEGVTNNEADTLAEILMGKLKQEFPAINFEAHRSGYQGLIEDDDNFTLEMKVSLEDQIQLFIERNLTECFNHEDMIFDLRQVLSDEAGHMWAEYGNGKMIPITTDTSPEEITFEYATNINQAADEPQTTTKLVCTFDSDSEEVTWTAPEQMSVAGLDYCVTHTDNKDVLDAIQEFAKQDETKHEVITLGDNEYLIWQAGSLWAVDPQDFDPGVLPGQFSDWRQTKEDAIECLQFWYDNTINEQLLDELEHEAMEAEEANHEMP